MHRCGLAQLLLESALERALGRAACRNHFPFASMSIHAALHHVTHYQYDGPIHLGPQLIRLRPAPHCRSKIVSYSLRVEPAQHFVNWQQDPFANYQARFVFPEKTTEFKVTVGLVVEMAVYNPFDFFLEPEAEQFPFDYRATTKQELAPYLATDPLMPQLQSYLAQIDCTPRHTIDFLVDLNARLHRDIAYLLRLKPGVQSTEETLEKRSGSCRDSAWLMVQLLRYLGLAARFASGYLIQLKPDVKSLDGPSGTEVDFTDLHAWCEVYLPGAGWIGLDPTSGLLAGEGHIPLACTPRPSGAAPIEGGLNECEVQFHHLMEVTRIYESPRVTKPYTEEQWSKVLALGEQVDQVLDAGNVRLTMGGEPTFVAIRDRDAPEWNTDALGPTKRGYATELIHKLHTEYGQGGFLHFGQGPWHLGEPLPRWALSILWRADGEPIWHNPALFADERQTHHYTSEDAGRFAQTLASKLGLDKKFITPGYEDAGYYLWRERRLPPHEMERLRRVFDQKLDSVIGYVLPLQAKADAKADPHHTHWSSGPCTFREDRMYLIPGDSPMGYRLPLDALPWVSQDNDSHLPAPNPSAANAANAAICIETRNPMRANGPKAERKHDTDSARDGDGGALYVFMPPLQRLEDYLHLLVAIEATAQELGLQIVLEGYPAPHDPRLKRLKVIPNPGVIEVNIHPAHCWGELVQHTEFLYQAAYESGLCAEKFMTDGRHTGTGGGNHLVLGGDTPADSPFLRQPELLASLILYWHNHPSLSYLFSGMFIGPSSQGPRVDEARNDQVYELEIALQEIHANRKKFGQEMPPWLVDRTLRNILTDVTGNTHRSEFCIDKLYSPDNSTGRLGLLELRAFEMPPHAHMSIVQQLLLRALVARFWDQPYLAPATRWGTELHDRCLLPSFVRMDLANVLADMHQTGFAFNDAWFAPHFEFRFPLVGRVQSMGIELTLRNALEPWHWMSEEGSAASAVRYVDSSLERIEVLVSGFNQSRYVIACNGQPLPLQSTGVAGEYVAAVRYKAWNPPSSSRHPSIEPHAPLTFDIVDTWMKRSVGGCQYHVTHPGGRSYDVFPVNAYEAESRRLSRFVQMGHTPGLMPMLPATIELPHRREFPFTLDLRRTR